MSSSILLSVSLGVYLSASSFYILYVLFKKDQFGRTATSLLAFGLLIQAVALALRTLEVGHAPFVTLYETLVFWSWLIALVLFFLQLRLRISALGALVAPLAFLAIAFATALPSEQKKAMPLVPALQSRWLEFHIITCFIGYACFAVSFVAGIAYLIKRKDALVSKDDLDKIGYRSISLGFPFLTLGIVSGAIWANVAWGRYWSWDPKETWALITWLVYAIYLHLRIVAKWRGRSSAIASIVGFVCVMFTFIGVNFLLPGLHSYL